MTINLLFVSTLVLIGIIIGVVLTVLLDYRVDQWLRRTVFRYDEQSAQQRAVATFLRWGLHILIMIGLLKLIVSTPFLALRQVTSGAVIGVGFAFFFLVGSYIKVKIASKPDSADQSA